MSSYNGDNGEHTLPGNEQKQSSVVQPTKQQQESRNGNNQSNDDVQQLEQITDDLILAADGDEVTSDTANQISNGGTSPITSYDALFQTQTPNTEGTSLFEQPPKDAFNFGNLQATGNDDPSSRRKNRAAVDDEDRMMRIKQNEEVVFEEDVTPQVTPLQPLSKSVQFKNLPHNPPELLADDDSTDEEIHQFGKIDGIEVTEEVEEGVEITEEIEEYEEVYDEGDQPRDEQMDDDSDSTQPIPDIVHQKAEIEESPEYDPDLEYDETDDSDDSDEDEEEDETLHENDDEEEMDHALEVAAMSSLVTPESDEKLEEPKAVDTEITATAPDIDDEQSEILSSDEEGEELVDKTKITEGTLVANEAMSGQHPQNGDPPSDVMFSTEVNLDRKHDPEDLDHTPIKENKDVTARESAKLERKRMIPLVLCIALTIIVGVIVVLIIFSQREQDDNALTVVPITSSPTGFLRTPVPTPWDSTTATDLPPIFTPVAPQSPPPSVPVPNNSSVAPPIIAPVAPTTPAPSSAQSPISDPTNNPVTSIPTTIIPTLPPQLPAEPQENDDCINAIGPLPADGSTIQGDLRAATPDEVDRCGDASPQGPGVWFYVIGTGGEMMAHTCLDGMSDTKITVFKGTCLKPECIDGNEDFCGSQSVVSWQSNYQQVYHILVSGPATPFTFGSFSLAIVARVNDECETAAGPLTIGSGPLVTGNTLEANPNAIECDGESNVSPSVWYKIRGTGADVTVSTCLGSNFDVRISVLVGSCDSPSCVARSDVDECSITFASEMFVEYYLVIHGTEATDVGQFDLELTTNAVQDNDSCENAFGPLPLESGSFFAIGSTVGATAESEVPFCGLFSTAPGVWFYVIGTGNQIQVSLCNGASYDTRLSVYEGTCEGNDYSGLTCVEANDDFCGQQSLVTWQSEVGAIYQILVHGYLQSSGDFTLEVTELIG